MKMHLHGSLGNPEGVADLLAVGSDEQAVARYVERVAGELTEMGMQRMASRVFACILEDDAGALTAAEVKAGVPK